MTLRNRPFPRMISQSAGVYLRRAIKAVVASVVGGACIVSGCLNARSSAFSEQSM